LSSEIFKSQLTTLTLTLNEIEKNDDIYELIAKIFNSIFIIFKRVTTLILDESSFRNRVRLCLTDPLLTNFHSSTLLQLVINVQCFDDCLYLLDGRFPHLHTLYVELANMYFSNEIPNQVS
jgi:hypothetical protein